MENKFALKALDKLSSAQPPAGRRMPGFGRRKTPRPTSATVSRDPSYEVLNELPSHFQQQQPLSSPQSPDIIIDVGTKNVKHSKKKRRAVASMLLDQVGEAISSLTVKDLNYHKRGMGSTHSARLLARKVFAALSDAYPPRNLVVSGI